MIVKAGDIFIYGSKLCLAVTIRSSDSTWPVVATNMETGAKDTYERDQRSSLKVKPNNKEITGVSLELISDHAHNSYTLEVLTEGIPIGQVRVHSPTKDSVLVIVNELINDLSSAALRTEALTKSGSIVTPEAVILEEHQPVLMEIKGGSLHDRFNSVVGSMSELTKGINESTALSETGELAALFIETQEKIRELLGKSASKPASIITRALVSLPFGDRLLTKGTAAINNNASIQDNINLLFGSIHEKYEKLLVVGEGLQSAKAHMASQVTALKLVAEESVTAIAAYREASDIPMRVISLDTQIQASVAKYQSRIMKLEGAITATQATITALGRDLPSMKTDLTDEMAIGTLLSSLDDYQKMWGDIAGLVSDVAETTSEKVHTSVENLLQLQIDDTHTMEYLANTAKRTEKFQAMITQKTTSLAAKVAKDAKIISSITNNVAIENVRREVRKIA